MTDTADVAGDAWLSPSRAPLEALPHPVTDRWQPLRLGLVDMFHYDDEQFWFHDGRLLLRGNNGTGKSKVLALTLPFLLDGSIAPRRVEPDADPKKRMEWNLLLGGAHGNPERTGYTWVEFGRLAADGTPRFTTLGIGLKAATGRGIVKTWYFTTTRRIGDLHLIDEARTVLTAERLRDAIGTSGTFHTTQEAYRRAVDEALFGLGEERYAALIDLLIQLRQPQLSKRPDEKALSAALTEALAPLDQAVVADVAESFRSLEEERDAIAEARDTLQAAEIFMRHYGAYAQVATRRHTTAVRVSNSKYEHAGRDLRDAEEAHATVVAEIAAHHAKQDDCEQRQGMLEGQAKALRESPEMRQAEGLRLAEQEATDAEEGARLAAAEVSTAVAVSEREGELARGAETKRKVTAQTAEEHETAAHHAGTAAGLADEHPGLAADRDSADRALNRRRQQIQHVRRFVEETRRARASAEQARVRLDETEATAAGRAEAVSTQLVRMDDVITSYRDVIGGYLAGLQFLHPEAGIDELTTSAEAWARSQSGESPARTAVEAARASADSALARQVADVEQSHRALTDRRTEITDRVTELESGRDPEPPSARWRDGAVREGTAGAPLWRLVDFTPDLDTEQRAGLEAALESSGLLDAWIFPDGTLHAAGDLVLGPHREALKGPTLGSVLIAAVGPGIDLAADVVTDVLVRVGLGSGSGADSGAALWVDTHGNWGAGPARGSWTKARAAYVGAGAREAHRQEVLSALREEQARVETELTALQNQLTALAEQRREVASELQQYPRQVERELADAHSLLAHAERELADAQAAVTTRHQSWVEAEAEAQEKAAELTEAANDLALGVTLEDLDEAMEAVTNYRSALVELWAATASARDALAAAEAATRRAEEAATTLAEREERAQLRRTDASGKRARADRLRETVGASVTELERQVTEVDQALTQVKAEQHQLTQAVSQATGRRGGLEERVQGLTVRRHEAAEERDSQVTALRFFAATGLFRVALPELDTPDPAVADEWNLTASIGLARAAEGSLDTVEESDEAWLRVQQRFSSGHQELASQMSRHGHTAIMDPRGDVSIVRVRYLNEEVDIDRLTDRLRDDVTARERLLTAREREILENHLVNEVAGHLHELLQRAQTQIEQMNQELATRKTSTGMQLRVQWKERADGPGGLAAARDLMLRSDATWTPADRTAIGDFLQARIGEVRQADPTGSWVEHLESALDYRHWHAFSVERFQNGQWRSASGPSSGGEKVLAVSVPLFAAATAHYNSASPLAPRLILLDEAFAGVDDDSRAKSLGLLATFDLDVVMTSEREWGCYPQVPGLAIAQLSRIEGVDAVGVTRWRWDGLRRQRLGEVDLTARAGAPAQVDPDPDESLFG